MTQTAAIITRTGTIQLELPSPDVLLLESVAWGALDAFPTPAYWRYQVIARRFSGRLVRYKLGRTFAEEVVGCLLGGHGIPAAIGIAAYERLRQLGAFTEPLPSEAQLTTWLREPLQVGGRSIRYRFAAQKARYIAAALPYIQAAPAFPTGKQLRNWLIGLQGIGPKTASWIARNWMDADDVAILDIHIMRVGQAIGLFAPKLTVERHYLELESLFLNLSQALDVRPSELDAVVWYEMASSPKTARVLIDQLSEAQTNTRRRAREKKNRQLQSTVA